MKKRIMAIVLLCVCTALVLCACSGGGTGSVNKAPLEGFDEPINEVLDTLSSSSNRNYKNFSYKWAGGWNGTNAPNKSALEKGCKAYTLVVKYTTSYPEYYKDEIYFALQSNGTLSPVAAHENLGGHGEEILYDYEYFSATQLVQGYYYDYYKETGQYDQLKGSRWF